MKIHLFHRLIFSALAGLLISIAAYSQQTPKTPEELQLFLNNLQKKADSMQNAMKNKKPGSDPNKTVSKQQNPVSRKQAMIRKI